MKNERHNTIIEIIGETPVYTQEQLRECLIRRGVCVTQATLSRDMRELGLIKGDKGYYLPEVSTVLPPLLFESVIGIDHALNTVVFRCRAGMAMAVCATFDSLMYKNVVGTLAGDDTIFVLMRSEKDAAALEREIGNLIFGRKGDD